MTVLNKMVIMCPPFLFSVPICDGFMCFDELSGENSVFLLSKSEFNMALFTKSEKIKIIFKKRLTKQDDCGKIYELPQNDGKGSLKFRVKKISKNFEKGIDKRDER